MINFTEIKAKKDGIVTPGAIIEKLTDNVEDIDVIVVVTKTKDGVISAMHSHEYLSTVVGLLEVGKMDAIDSMKG